MSIIKRTGDLHIALTQSIEFTLPGASAKVDGQQLDRMYVTLPIWFVFVVWLVVAWVIVPLALVASVVALWGVVA